MLKARYLELLEGDRCRIANCVSVLRTDEVVESAVERSRSLDEGVVYLYVLLSHVSKKRAEVKVTQAPDVAVSTLGRQKKPRHRAHPSIQIVTAPTFLDSATTTTHTELEVSVSCTPA